MHYDFIAIADADVPLAVDPTFQHILQTYASEANKTVSVWRAVPDDLLDFQPHEKTNPIRTILVHQLLSERRFFTQFVGTEEPPVDELPSPDSGADVAAAGRAARPGDLWAFRRREVGRGRPDLLPGGGKAGRLIPRRSRPSRSAKGQIPRRLPLICVDPGTRPPGSWASSL